MSTWLEKFWATTNASAFNKPIKIFIVEQVPCQSDSYSKQRANCPDFVTRYKDDGHCDEVDSPFSNISTNITGRQSKSLEDREIGRRFAPLWKALSSKQQEIFPERDVKGPFIVNALDVRSQILSILICRNGEGKPVFKLAPPGNEQLFDLAAPGLCDPSIPDHVLRQVICQASHLAQNLTANV